MAKSELELRLNDIEQLADEYRFDEAFREFNVIREDISYAPLTVKDYDSIMFASNESRAQISDKQRKFKSLIRQGWFLDDGDLISPEKLDRRERCITIHFEYCTAKHPIGPSMIEILWENVNDVLHRIQTAKLPAARKAEIAAELYEKIDNAMVGQTSRLLLDSIYHGIGYEQYPWEWDWTHKEFAKIREKEDEKGYFVYLPSGRKEPRFLVAMLAARPHVVEAQADNMPACVAFKQLIDNWVHFCQQVNQYGVKTRTDALREKELNIIRKELAKFAFIRWQQNSWPANRFRSLDDMFSYVENDIARVRTFAENSHVEPIEIVVNMLADRMEEDYQMTQKGVSVLRELVQGYDSESMVVEAMNYLSLIVETELHIWPLSNRAKRDLAKLQEMANREPMHIQGEKENKAPQQAAQELCDIYVQGGVGGIKTARALRCYYLTQNDDIYRWKHGPFDIVPYDAQELMVYCEFTFGSIGHSGTATLHCPDEVLVNRRGWVIVRLIEDEWRAVEISINGKKEHSVKR